MSNIELSMSNVEHFKKNHKDSRGKVSAPRVFVVIVKLLAADGLLCVVEQGTCEKQEHED